MSKKLIDLHWKWMKQGFIDGNGLCNSLPNRKYSTTLSFFTPSFRDEMERMNTESFLYWGHGEQSATKGFAVKSSEYTPRRQSIVLLICAMHDEL